MQRRYAQSFSGFGGTSQRASSSVAMGQQYGYGGGVEAYRRVRRSNGGSLYGMARGAAGLSYGGGAAGLSYGGGAAGLSYGGGAAGISYGGGAAGSYGYGGGIKMAQASTVGGAFGMGGGASSYGAGAFGRSGGGVVYGTPGGPGLPGVPGMIGLPGMGGVPGVPGDIGYAPFSVNEKQLLQTLNDRLASYLDKVKNLEITNRELEDKLRAFTINKVQIRDLQVYEDQLIPLRQQVLTLLVDNSRTALELDNAKLTADDFRVKYETEYTMRQSVESDVCGLKTLKTDYDFSIQALGQELQLLTDELTNIKTAHELEVVALRNEMAGTVVVDMDVADTTNLTRVLEEMRAEYEAVVATSRAEVETWYNKQVELRQHEETMTSETTVTTSSEILETRKSVHTMQTELDSLRVTKLTLEETLIDCDTQCQMQLQRINNMVVTNECELCSLRDQAMLQAQEYQQLLNMKMKLEMEIATYKQLLETADLGAVLQQTGGVVVAGGGVLVTDGPELKQQFIPSRVI
ncbi:hypothetical protein COCON_G00024210 [Conger conger]|uniref:IF rod domain-containing protein n=1 Tax=Conger conger TaxID=82655 RepID=A0A9Q1DXC4_CONCO|nr:hypothetical protein COCON_G00024210 [Conger conger]